MNALVPKLLVVDDEAHVREFLAEALGELCLEIKLAADLPEALCALAETSYDIVLSDICMPGYSGIGLLQLSARCNWDSAIILMTGHGSLEHVAQSVRLDAADFLVKPFTIGALLHAVSKAYEKLLMKRQQNLRRTYGSVLESVLLMLKAREPDTCSHSFRVRAYALHIAELMGCQADELSRLGTAALLHDVGKVAVPDSVLLKPGSLTPSEFEKLEMHPVVGERIIRSMGLLPDAASVVRHHHERWDGNGYPDHLHNTETPFGARLFAVADTLDAMTSDRCYRPSLSFANARAEIAICSGTQFDPEIADAFLSMSEVTWPELRDEADEAANRMALGISTDPVRQFSPVPVQLSSVTVGL